MTAVFADPRHVVVATQKMAEFIHHAGLCQPCSTEWNRRADKKLPLYRAPRGKDVTVYEDNLCHEGLIMVVMAAKASSDLWNGALWLKS